MCVCFRQIEIAIIVITVVLFMCTGALLCFEVYRQLRNALQLPEIDIPENKTQEFSENPFRPHSEILRMEYQRVRVTDLPGIRHDGLVVPGLAQQDAPAERFTSTHCSAGVPPSSEGTSSTPVVPGCAPNVEMPSSAPRFSLSTPSRENVDVQCLSLPSTNCSDRNNDFLLPSTPDFALPFTQNRCGKSAARERNRVRMLQSAFLSLQRALPAVPRDTKLSRLDVLLLASAYIRELVHALKSPGCPDPDLDCAALHPLKKWTMRSRLYAAITATVHPHPPSSRDGFCPATLPQNPLKGHLAGVRVHQPKAKGHEARIRVHTVKIMDSRSSL